MYWPLLQKPRVDRIWRERGSECLLLRMTNLELAATPTRGMDRYDERTADSHHRASSALAHHLVFR